MQENFSIMVDKIRQNPFHSLKCYSGKWQILVADLTWQGNKCPSPAGCGNVANKKDAFDFLYNK